MNIQSLISDLLVDTTLFMDGAASNFSATMPILRARRKL